MATANPTDFLRFSAYSFKDLLTRKFSENTKFTDQIYEGSNLAILIDLCSYLFQGLTYCINAAAAESMFSDTKIYQNISRLVKMIGYHPKGFIPSSCQFEYEVDGDSDELMIPKFTAVDTKKTDSNGKKIYYSFVDVNNSEESRKTSKEKTTTILYNGRWRMYNTVFTASGTKYETFTLTGVKSSVVDQQYAAHGFIEVYVKRGDAFLKFKGITDEMFLSIATKYDGSEDAINIFKNTDDDRYFSIRLNENKEYEIKFGNDNNGQKLQKDDKVYVFYMESNGFDAVLQIGEVQYSSYPFKEPAQLLGVNDEFLYKGIMGCTDDMMKILKTIFNRDESSDVNIKITKLINTTQSTVAQAEEDVDDIRETAPDYYKLGNRLVSKSDYEYYVKNRFKDNIIDAKCQNNWDYISTFYGWLYKLGKNGVRTQQGKTQRKSDPRYYIDTAKLLKHDYFYADPADENNVYIWVRMHNNYDIWKQRLDEDLNAIKILTAELVFLDPIHVSFAICAAPVERVLEYLDEDTIFDKDDESYIEVTINDNSLYSNTSIKMQISTIFNKFFQATQLKLGQVVSLNDIEQRIYAINGVQRVRTVFSSNAVDEYGQKKYKDRFVDGISFATWSSSMIDIGDDLEVSTMNRTLEDFQFPQLQTLQLQDKIKIIKRSFSNNSTVQY